MQKSRIRKELLLVTTIVNLSRLLIEVTMQLSQDGTRNQKLIEKINSQTKEVSNTLTRYHAGNLGRDIH